MIAKEALEMLKSAPNSEIKPARINKGLTQFQSVNIVRKCIEGYASEYILPPLIEKRVWQVYLNRKKVKME